MKNKNLWILFGVLLGLYVLSQLFTGGKSVRSFDPVLFPLDTAKITTLEINAKADEMELVKLNKTATGWTATKGNITTPAESSRVTSLLSQLIDTKAQRIAAKKKEKWTPYEMEESAAKAHIRVLEGSKAVADFWVGGFRFNQQTRSGTSFLRLSDADDVYAVDGFISMSFSQGFDSYRDKTIVKFNPADLTQITLTQNGQTSSYSNTSGQWITNTGIALDSTKMASYLSSLASRNGNVFADDFQEEQAAILSRHSITFVGNNMLQPIVVNCFEVTGEKPFVCKSSLNPDAYFSGDSTSLFLPLFKPLAELQ